MTRGPLIPPGGFAPGEPPPCPRHLPPASSPSRCLHAPAPPLVGRTLPVPCPPSSLPVPPCPLAFLGCTGDTLDLETFNPPGSPVTHGDCPSMLSVHPSTPGVKAVTFASERSHEGWGGLREKSPCPDASTWLSVPWAVPWDPQGGWGRPPGGAAPGNRHCPCRVRCPAAWQERRWRSIQQSCSAGSKTVRFLPQGADVGARTVSDRHGTPSVTKHDGDQGGEDQGSGIRKENRSRAMGRGQEVSLRMSLEKDQGCEGMDQGTLREGRSWQNKEQVQRP